MKILKQNLKFCSFLVRNNKTYWILLFIFPVMLWFTLPAYDELTYTHCECKSRFQNIRIRIIQKATLFICALNDTYRLHDVCAFF